VLLPASLTRLGGGTDSGALDEEEVPDAVVVLGGTPQCAITSMTRMFGPLADAEPHPANS
jgi:hypothetical protein